jgi:hypoxanthine phosphoribosyltransferase
MNRDLERILLTEAQIKARVEELGKQITNDYQGKTPLLIGVLRGAVIFFSDLCRAIKIPVELDFVNLSSYNTSAFSSGEVKIRQHLIAEACNKDIIIVEDIIDTGLTMQTFKEWLLDKKACSVEICTLLKKPEQQCSVAVSYKGFDIGNSFVVGYGLDYAERYRNLPYLGVLKKEIYSK